MESNLDLGLWLLVWMVAASGIVLTQWKRKMGGVGLVFAYILLLWGNHWLPASLYVLPWYIPVFDTHLVKLGFQQSLYGVIAFAGGALIMGPFLWRFHLSRPRRTSPEEPAFSAPDPRLPKTYLIIGLASYFVLAPLAKRVPTLNALTVGFSKLWLAGLALAYWQAWQRRDRRALIRWLLVAAIWPLITIAGWGFLGYGIEILVAMLMFVLQLAGFRKRFIFVALLVGYVGLSVYVTYMQNRQTIRAVVWSSESSLGQRTGIVYSAFDQFEWFDLHNPNHLYWFDDRLKQNYSVGIAMYRLSHGYVDYARGGTIWEAILMLVPRALWPDKPMRSGGSSAWTEYTGIPVYGIISIDPGQVMEFYINFGTTGVVLGFLLLGTLLAVMDEGAARNLHRGAWQQFALWYLPGIGLTQPASKLVSVVATSAAGLVATVLMNKLLLPVLIQGRSGRNTRAGAGLLPVHTVPSQRLSARSNSKANYRVLR